MGEKINVDKREKQKGCGGSLHPLAIYSYTVSRSKELLLIAWINLDHVKFNSPLDNESRFIRPANNYLFN